MPGNKTFSCYACDYTTTDQSNYQRHCKSNRHKKRVRAFSENSLLHHDDTTTTPEKTPFLGVKVNQVSNMSDDVSGITSKSNTSNEHLRCSRCQQIFSRPSSLTRHVNRCRIKHNREIELEQENEKIKDELEKYQSLTEILREQIQNSKKGIKKSVPQLLTENFKSAPNMNPMNGKDIEKLKEPKKKLVEEFISAYKHRTLDKLLGDFILSKFKKEDISQQAIHNTDVTRLSYVIKEPMYDNTSEWVVDKKGVRATRYMITPLLNHVKQLCKEYQLKHTFVDPSDTSYSHRDLEKMSDNSRLILDIYNYIDDGKLSKKIHSYIAPKLIFDKDISKEINNKDLKILLSKNHTNKKK